MSKKRVGPKRRKGGSGMIGMGRGDLAQGGGSITRKTPSSKSIQDNNDRVGAKTVRVNRAAAAFASKARAAKSKKTNR
jgi:hypothetical protein